MRLLDVWVGDAFDVAHQRVMVALAVALDDRLAHVVAVEDGVEVGHQLGVGDVVLLTVHGGQPHGRRVQPQRGLPAAKMLPGVGETTADEASAKRRAAVELALHFVRQVLARSADAPHREVTQHALHDAVGLTAVNVLQALEVSVAEQVEQCLAVGLPLRGQFYGRLDLLISANQPGSARRQRRC